MWYLILFEKYGVLFLSSFHGKFEKAEVCPLKWWLYCKEINILQNFSSLRHFHHSQIKEL